MIDLTAEEKAVAAAQASYLTARTISLTSSQEASTMVEAEASLKRHREQLQHYRSVGSVKRLKKCKELIKQAEIQLGYRGADDSSSSSIDGIEDPI
jgi:hypothetical protein